MFANHHRLTFFHRIASTANKSNTFPLSQPLVPVPLADFFSPLDL